MAITKPIKETVPFNFDEIYEGIAKKFEEKGYDSPYDGSNLAQLITSMAYTTSMLNANTAVNINETILTLAQKRPNIIQDARLLGYESTPSVSYIYELIINVKEDGDYYIPQYTKFLADGNTYYYMGEDKDLRNLVQDNKITLLVKEGELIKSTDEPENLRQVIANNQFLDIPYENIEADGIEVFGTYYTPSGVLTNKTKFLKSNTLLIDKDDKLPNQFIRMENVDMNTPRIYFVLSGVGTPIPQGAIIDINVLKTKGLKGIMTSIPTFNIADLEVLSFETSVTAKEEESNESIKENAPVLYNTASRCVTANDYSVVAKKHSAVQEAFIFGGEDEIPKLLGNVFLSFTPEGKKREFQKDADSTLWELKLSENILNNYITESEIISDTVDSEGNTTNPGVLDNIKLLNLPALNYNIRHPNYVYVDFDITVVKYSLSSARSKVRESMFDLLSEYMKKLELYNSNFLRSNAINFLDDYLTETTGLDMEVKFQIMLTEKSLLIDEVLNKKAVIYLDTPFEGLYNSNGSLNIDNIPRIDTIDFIGTDDLVVDYTWTEDPMVKALNKPEILFPIKLNGTEIGLYKIYNVRTSYIKIELDLDMLPDTFVHYLDLKYPSQNLKLLRTSFMKLRNVSIR